MFDISFHVNQGEAFGGSAIAGALLLLAGAVVLYVAGIAVFDRKDLHI